MAIPLKEQRKRAEKSIKVSKELRQEVKIESGRRQVSMVTLLEQAWRKFVGTDSLGLPTVLPRLDGTTEGDQTSSTAPSGGDGQIEFEVEGVKYTFTPTDLAWLIRLHRVLRCKNQNLANAIRSNLVAFEESVSARERVSELEERLSKLELERGRTTDVSELRDDKPGAAEKLSLPKGHAPSGGKKPSAGGGKRHTD